MIYERFGERDRSQTSPQSSMVNCPERTARGD